MQNLLTLCVRILRDPTGLILDSETAEGVAKLAAPALLIAIAGTALLGVVCGTYRGGVQVLFVAIKMPALFLLPLLIALPAAHALYSACGVNLTWTRLSAAALVGVARTGVLAAAFSPVLWLYYSVHPGYHHSILVLAGAVTIVGLPGLVTLARALPKGGSLRIAATAGTILVIGMTMAQSGWLLRPFVTRPTADIAFLRPVEEDILSALLYTSASSVEHYPGWDASSEGALGRKP
ncbi:MAG: hypothetical protein ACI9MC_003379 [Kiritimatiellia bacterium]|jgi:hypothetical protein